MKKEEMFSEIKVLIVEDNPTIRESAVQTLLKHGFEDNKIFDTAFAMEAIRIIENENPDAVLLDLKIPYENQNGPVEIRNAQLILDRIKINNIQYGYNTRVIMFSGSIENKDSQLLMKNELVLDFIDKGEVAADHTLFEKKLVESIAMVCKKADREPSRVDIRILWEKEFRKLESLYPDLWKKIREEIFDEFSKLGDRKVNVHAKVKQIIIACGEVVEEVIDLIDQYLPAGSNIRSRNDLHSVRDRLNYLTGRLFDQNTNSFLLVGPAYISRSAGEYAAMAYRLRNETAHGKENDEGNRRLFPHHQFTKEDAAVSISLIIPLLKEILDRSWEKGTV